jgi:hypothetical protein
VCRWFDTEIVLQFAIDVRQAAGERADLAVNRKRKTDRVTGRWVWVLTDDDDSHRIQWLFERPQD